MRCFSLFLIVSGLAFAGERHLHPPEPGEIATSSTPSDTEEDKEGLPLELTRPLSFTTSAGTWLSVDVHPDGRTVLFDLLGDLYTVPIEGGTATRITSGPGFDAEPRYSPDGETILFVSDRDGGENLWTLETAGGEPEQRTEGKGNLYQDPAWSPDGNYIIASRSAGFGISKLLLIHVDGGSGVELMKKPDDRRATGAVFSPDGRYIWHATRMRGWNYNAVFPQYQLAVYDRDEGKIYTRTSRYGSAYAPTLSPDGKVLVYATRHQARTGLVLRELESGDERWLAYPVQRDDVESRATRGTMPNMAFTPDGKEVLTTWDGKIWRVPIAGGDPIEVPFTAEVDMMLGPEVYFDYEISDAPEFTARQIRDARPSPDGKKLAFTVLDRLYVMGWPEGTPRRLTDLGVTEAQPAWSPDSSEIVFATWSHADGGHLYKVAAGGGTPTRLTEQSGVYTKPVWSPAGDRIVVIRGAARAYREATGPFAAGAADDLVWIGSGGGTVTLIAPREGRDDPHFTEDETRIYLHHGQKGLVSIRWDGSDERAHLKATWKKAKGQRQPGPADTILMAPKGDRALVAFRRNLFVVTVPRIGADAPEISLADPDKASFPARRITDIGGEFPAWSADGNRVHFSMGNAHFVYDIPAAETAEAEKDAREKAEKEAKEEAGGETEDGDEPEDEGKDEKEEEEPVYEPFEKRIEIAIPRDIPEGLLLLRGARLITMKGDEVIERGDILIENNRIREIGTRVRPPEGTRVMEMRGKTIVPGFIDTHAHMWPAWGLHKGGDWQYLVNLAYGVTTTRDPQTATTDVLTYGDLVTAGRAIGPRIYSTGPGVFSFDFLDSETYVKRFLRQYAEYYDTKTIKMYMTGNRQQRQWVIDAARELELMPTSEGGLDFEMNLTTLIDGYPGHEHSFPVYPVYDDVLKLMVASKTAYTPTLLVSYGGPWAEDYFYATENVHDDPKLRRFTPYEAIESRTRRRGGNGDRAGWFMEEEHIFSRHAEFLADLVAAGGIAGVGSHGQLQGLGYHWELWAMQAGGMSEHDALKTATILGAEAIGLETELGSLEPGKLADLVVLEADPRENIRNTNTVFRVMINGRLYDGDTLAELWPEERETDLSPWQSDLPTEVPGTAGSGGR